MSDLLNLVQAEAGIYFADWGQCLTYTPAHPKNTPASPVQIQGIWQIHETGKLVQEGNKQRYHKAASLMVFQGNFQQGDEFDFVEERWKLEGSPSTNLDGTQTLEVVSKELYELGDFRQRT
jgi:hypothetical protein